MEEQDRILLYTVVQSCVSLLRVTTRNIPLKHRARFVYLAEQLDTALTALIKDLEPKPEEI